MLFLLLVSSFSAISDLTVLNSFYKSTGGEYWTNNEGWDSDDFCNRFGVTCDSNNRVISLYLQGNNLTGTIPNNFGYLNKLQGLDFTGNNLTGNLPQTMANMQSLSAMFRYLFSS